MEHNFDEINTKIYQQKNWYKAYSDILEEVCERGISIEDFFRLNIHNEIVTKSGDIIEPIAILFAVGIFGELRHTKKVSALGNNEFSFSSKETFRVVPKNPRKGTMT